ncbi:Uncharacterised protein [Bordetella pertussis]|nr:Uncharacterised protein [Bordetella pertussis]CFO73528.1 Uncharacterised protein [Bordetella pertussis]CFU83534.1 Uncharacterised protein [Bordetella pertussis]CPI12920.1 Uncharacterised protein [Bordetella pertussis]CPK73448.1 Uncharacterised protein [Bordetella pertussis]
MTAPSRVALPRMTTTIVPMMMGSWNGMASSESFPNINYSAVAIRFLVAGVQLNGSTPASLLIWLCIMKSNMPVGAVEYRVTGVRSLGLARSA